MFPSDQEMLRVFEMRSEAVFFQEKKKSKYCGLWQERLKRYGITIAPFGGRGKKYIYTCT